MIGRMPPAAGTRATPARELDVAERRWLERPHHRLERADARYARLLGEHRGARPAALYVAGRLAALEGPRLTIVGSRRATAAGLEIAHRFAAALARHGLVIASGLATGIDTAAHRGALRGGGATIAVLPGGLDRIYPCANSPLAAEIA